MRINDYLHSSQYATCKPQKTVAKSVATLSPGLRISAANDDAAGLGVSEKLRAQIRGTQQATRNATDGISYLQVAEGALNEVTDILQRMREMSVQALSDTLTSTDRCYLNLEFQNSKSEVNRIVNTTNFNKIKIFSTDPTTTIELNSQPPVGGAGGALAADPVIDDLQALNLDGVYNVERVAGVSEVMQSQMKRLGDLSETATFSPVTVNNPNPLQVATVSPGSHTVITNPTQWWRIDSWDAVNEAQEWEGNRVDAAHPDLVGFTMPSDPSNHELIHLYETTEGGNPSMVNRWTENTDYFFDGTGLQLIRTPVNIDGDLVIAKTDDITAASIGADNLNNIFLTYDEGGALEQNLVEGVDYTLTDSNSDSKYDTIRFTGNTLFRADRSISVHLVDTFHSVEMNSAVVTRNGSALDPSNYLLQANGTNFDLILQKGAVNFNDTISVLHTSSVALGTLPSLSNNAINYDSILVNKAGVGQLTAGTDYFYDSTQNLIYFSQGVTLSGAGAMDLQYLGSYDISASPVKNLSIIDSNDSGGPQKLIEGTDYWLSGNRVNFTWNAVNSGICSSGENLTLRFGSLQPVNGQRYPNPPGGAIDLNTQISDIFIGPFPATGSSGSQVRLGYMDPAGYQSFAIDFTSASTIGSIISGINAACGSSITAAFNNGEVTLTSQDGAGQIFIENDLYGDNTFGFSVHTPSSSPLLIYDMSNGGNVINRIPGLSTLNPGNTVGGVTTIDFTQLPSPSLQIGPNASDENRVTLFKRSLGSIFGELENLQLKGPMYMADSAHMTWQQIMPTSQGINGTGVSPNIQKSYREYDWVAPGSTIRIVNTNSIASSERLEMQVKFSNDSDYDSYQDAVVVPHSNTYNNLSSGSDLYFAANGSKFKVYEIFENGPSENDNYQVFISDGGGGDNSRILSSIDTIVDDVTKIRVKLGSSINRLEHTINNNIVSEREQTAAESVIRDADFAKMVSELVRSSILSQVAVAITSQLYQVTRQSVLGLIGSI